MRDKYNVDAFLHYIAGEYCVYLQIWTGLVVYQSGVLFSGLLRQSLSTCFFKRRVYEDDDDDCDDECGGNQLKHRS